MSGRQTLPLRCLKRPFAATLSHPPCWRVCRLEDTEVDDMEQEEEEEDEEEPQVLAGSHTRRRPLPPASLDRCGPVSPRTGSMEP